MRQSALPKREMLPDVAMQRSRAQRRIITILFLVIWDLRKKEKEREEISVSRSLVFLGVRRGIDCSR